MTRNSEDSDSSSDSIEIIPSQQQGALQVQNVTTNHEVNNESIGWHPLHVVFVSKDYNQSILVDIVSVVILVPSGIKQFSFKVIDDGHKLSFTATWPDVLCNAKMLHKRWVDGKHGTAIQEYHPRIIGYQEAVNELKNSAGSSLESTTYISLPMPVLPKIRESHFLGYEGCHSQVYYIDLTACTNDQEVIIVNKQPDIC